jgi:hypothetical protein
MNTCRFSWLVALLFGLSACGSESDEPSSSSGGTSSGGSAGTSGSGGVVSTGGAAGAAGAALGGAGGASGAAGAAGAGGARPATLPIWTQHNFADSFAPTLAKYGAVESCLIRQSLIDADSDGVFDGATGKFESKVLECPDTEVALVFDWEGAYGSGQGFMTALSGKDGSSKQSAAIDEALKVLVAAKALRPKALVGFYNIPNNGGSYKAPLNPPAWWTAQLTSLAPLVAASDALYPSMYQPYQIGDGGQISLEDDQKVEGNYAKLALQIANGKPVYPYVWELYHNANLPVDMTPIPTQELYWHVQGAMSAEVNGAKVAGLVWWGMAAGPDGTEPALKAFRQALDGAPYAP